jgi:acetyl-CoA synthetase
MYEGAPDYPDPGRWWSIVEKYGATILYTAPTAIRLFMRYGEKWPAKYDLSSLRLLGTVGEPINPEAWIWYYKNIGGGNCQIMDTWWQTETGMIMVSNLPGIDFMKPGSAGLPVPGVRATIYNAGKEEIQTGGGLLAITYPWPAMLRGIWGDPERYKQAYWSRYPGVYYTGDYAVKDEEGYFWMLGRADEVIKVAGHRLGTLEIENAAVAFPAVAEAAAASKPDPVKGESIVVFTILRDREKPSPEMAQALSKHIRDMVGPIATPDRVFFVSRLPKTRSGKIMRRVLRAVAADQAIGDVTTLEDEASVEEVKRAYEELKQQI